MSSGVGLAPSARRGRQVGFVRLQPDLQAFQIGHGADRAAAVGDVARCPAPSSPARRSPCRCNFWSIACAHGPSITRKATSAGRAETKGQAHRLQFGRDARQECGADPGHGQAAGTHRVDVLLGAAELHGGEHVHRQLVVGQARDFLLEHLFDGDAGLGARQQLPAICSFCWATAGSARTVSAMLDARIRRRRRLGSSWASPRGLEWVGSGVAGSSRSMAGGRPRFELTPKCLRVDQQQLHAAPPAVPRRQGRRAAARAADWPRPARPWMRPSHTTSPREPSLRPGCPQLLALVRRVVDVVVQIRVSEPPRGSSQTTRSASPPIAIVPLRGCKP